MSDFKRLFTSESVTEGHPDKMADQISDAVLDAILKKDITARVACETFLTTGMALVGGEITTDCYVEIPEIVRNTIRDIGYIKDEYGIGYKNCAVLTSIDKQSEDIKMGVDESLGHPQGAGDQGMMFGYACNETPEFMPITISYAHKLAKKLADVRKSGFMEYLRPDGKTQVTFEYVNGKPTKVNTVVVSAQHADGISHDRLFYDIKENVIKAIIPDDFLSKDTKILINPTGRFVLGGPHADAGLTGRKIIVDTYGGKGSHGGGAFSGKDPSKVDRSASYIARYIAKNIVAAELASECEVQLSYAIGYPEPISIMIETFGTGKIDEEYLVKVIRKNLDLSPKGIINKLDLYRPIYKLTAAYGHFGREIPEFTWEKTDFKDILLKNI